MKKRRFSFLVILISILVVSFFISAFSFNDFLGKITGSVISYDDENLVSIYLFDNVNDLGADYNGVNSMSTSYIGSPAGNDPEQSTDVPSGFSGYSIDLDGDDSVCISSGFTFDPSQSHTLCFWSKLDSTASRDQFAQFTNYDSWVISPEKYRWATRNLNATAWNDLDVSSVFSIGNWVHICNNYDSSTLIKTIYVNGNPSGTQIVDGIRLTTGRWCIGSYGTGSFIDGKIFQPVWFDESLSSNEINQIYEGTYFTQSSTPSEEQVCENNIIEGTEVCDGTSLNSQTCITQGFVSGTLSCLSDCSGYDISECISSCNEFWSCSNWTDCINSSRTRVCTDANNCGTNISRPIEVRDCGSLCTENWVCTWSECINNNQEKICVDKNNCTTEYDKPQKETRVCNYLVGCGNDLIEGGEFCDGLDLGGDSCKDVGFDGGALSCLSDCSGYDTSSCTIDLGVECVGQCANKKVKSVNLEISGDSIGGVERLVQSPAEIGKDVKWIKNIQMSDSVNYVSFSLPKDSSFIRIRKFVDSVRNKTLSREDIKKLKEQVEGENVSSLQEGEVNVGGDIYLEKEYISIEEKNILLAFLNAFSSFFKQLNAKQLNAYFSETEDTINVIIEEPFDEIEIEYYTEAPKIIEKEISDYNKTVTVYSEEGLDYENILSYTKINEFTSDVKDIKLYWLVDGVQKQINSFTLLDENNNGLFDKIEWIVPHLSNQTFMIVLNPPEEGEDKEYLELLVATSDSVFSKKPFSEWTSEMIKEERSGNTKQGYIIQANPEGWSWGKKELDPKRFAIIKIPKSDFNEEWLEPEYDINGGILIARKYRLPLESFLSESELEDLRNIPYNDPTYREPIIKTLDKISNLIEEVDWENRPEEMKLHGSSGVFTICPSGCDYSSLVSWESGENSDLTGTGPCIANITEGFEEKTTGDLLIRGWTTTAEDYIKIVTTPEARHTGKFDSSKYYFNSTGTSSSLIGVMESFVNIDGLQLLYDEGGIDTNVHGLYLNPGGENDANERINISNNIIMLNRDGVGMNGVGIYAIDLDGAIINIFNNVLFEVGSAGSAGGIQLADAETTSYVFSNTIINDEAIGFGVRVTAGTAILKNNLVKSIGACYLGTYDGTSDYNACNGTDTTDTGTHNVINAEYNFVDYLNYDAHLTSSSTDVLDVGEDLSSIFTIDIDGQTRTPGAWDIGADEYFLVGDPICPNNIIELGETCDGNSRACTTAEGYSGTQECNPTCDGWEVCVTTELCSDNIINGLEICDGTSLNSQTCITQGFASGTLSCLLDCSGYDTTQCISLEDFCISKTQCSDYSQQECNSDVCNLGCRWSVSECAVYVASETIIADHTVVDLYDTIPQYWIDEVKKKIVNIPGESHGRGYMYGLESLEAQDSRFAVEVTWTGAPEADTDQHLRAVRTHWTGSSWEATGGEEDFYTNIDAINMMNNYLSYMDSNGNTIDNFGFGWCWDMTWLNGLGGEIDPEYNVHWAGASIGGPEGNLRWGLDDGDTALTGNSVNLHTYLDAVENYNLNNPQTNTFFTTGPVDGYAGESGYQRYLKQQEIRNYVNENGGILFDYGDILSWNEAGQEYTISWTDTLSNVHTFQMADPSYTTESYDGGDGGCHITEEACVRVAKALWWMLAREAGWDGNPVGESVCPNNIRESGEVCDGTDLSSQTCITQGFDGGDLSCLPDCSGYNTTECLSVEECSDCGILGFGCSLEDCHAIGDCYYDPTWIPLVTDCFNSSIACTSINSCSDYKDDECSYDSCNLGCEFSGGECIVSESPGYDDDLNLVSIYLFDNVNNLGADYNGVNSMSTSYTGSPVGNDPEQSTDVPSGFSGFSLELDGINDSVCISSGATFNPSQDSTFCWWAKPNSLVTADQFAQSSNYDSWIQSGVNYGWSTRNLDATAWNNLDVSSVYSLGEWSYICNKYDPSTLTKTVYVDGVLNETQLVDGIRLTTGRWCIGSYGTGSFFNGKIFQPVWFNNSLTDQEINQLYSNTYFVQTPVCSNNIIEGTETCDGTSLNSQTCITQGFASGTLSCLPDCSGYDTSECISLTDSGEDIYISQDGTGIGTSCVASLPVSWLNDGNNWGTGENQIGPGDTVHLCGVISENITVQGSGIQDNPITILFEDDAKISAPCFERFEGGSSVHGGAILVKYQDYITIDGGTNGVIENTDTGSTSLGYTYTRSQVGSSSYIGNIQGAAGIIAYESDYLAVRNLNIENIYVSDGEMDNLDPRYTGRKGDSGSNAYALDFANCNNLLVENNVIHDAIFGIAFNVGENYFIDANNNSIYHTAASFFVAGTGAEEHIGYNNEVKIHHNHIYDADNWAYIGGIKCIGSEDTMTLKGLKIYNNVVGPDMYDEYHDMTAYIYADQGRIVNPLIYNNTCIVGPNDGSINKSTHIFEFGGSNAIPEIIPVNAKVFDNTVISKTPYLLLFYNAIKNSTGHEIYNNIVKAESNVVFLVSSGSEISYCDNNNYYSFGSISLPGGLSAWQAQGHDVNSYFGNPLFVNENNPEGVDGIFYTGDDGLRPTAVELHNTGRYGDDIGAYEYISSTSVCPNNIRESGEVCDGVDLDLQNCITQGFDSGDLNCLPDCSGYDTSECTLNAVCTDVDGDNYYLESSDCDSEPGFLGHNDCDDTDINIHPNALEVCNGVDDNCVAGIDEGGDALCDNGLFCDGQEICSAGSCQLGTPISCSGNNILEVLTCENNPDNNAFTFDTRNAFTSSCQEPGICTTGDNTITSTCDIAQCSAECEQSADCSATDCDSQDSCVGNDYYDYNDVSNTCVDCSCTSNVCGTPTISYNDSVCTECQGDEDCNSLDNDYCDGDRIMHSEGRCVGYSCTTETTEIENCDDSDNTYCSGTEIVTDDYTCNLAACVLDSSTTIQDCDNGLFCDGQEICSAGSCQSGIVPQDNDNIFCTIESCNELTDEIIHVPDNFRCLVGHEDCRVAVCDSVAFVDTGGCGSYQPFGCYIPENLECSSCSNFFGIGCNNVSCHAIGNCYYDPSVIPFVEDCIDISTACNSIDECSDYSEYECNYDLCGISNCQWSLAGNCISLLKDLDADGIINEEDNCPSRVNINQLDYDEDTIGDACDNCKLDSNLNQEDEDNDGIGDFCDICAGTALEGNEIVNLGGCKLPEYSTFSADLTTNLSAKENLRNLTNFTIGKVNKGRIIFVNKNINLEGKDLERNIFIESKKILINSSGLVELNESAILQFYDVAYIKPLTYRDGSLCKDCNEISYSGGVYVVEVPHFSEYTLLEGYVAPVVSGGSSGSSGGGSSGGGSSSIALEDTSTCVPWSCSDWSICKDGFKTRFCSKVESCDLDWEKPSEKEACECLESWICGNWEDSRNQCGKRVCNDINNCGTEIEKPSEYFSCNKIYFGKFLGFILDWKYFVIGGFVFLVILIIVSIILIKRK
jgi:hypothetical protein